MAGRHPSALTMKRVIHSATPLAWADQREHFAASADRT